MSYRKKIFKKSQSALSGLLGPAHTTTESPMGEEEKMVEKVAKEREIAEELPDDTDGEKEMGDIPLKVKVELHEEGSRARAHGIVLDSKETDI